MEVRRVDYDVHAFETTLLAIRTRGMPASSRDREIFKIALYPVRKGTSDERGMNEKGGWERARGKGTQAKRG